MEALAPADAQSGARRLIGGRCGHNEKIIFRQTAMAMRAPCQRSGGPPTRGHRTASLATISPCRRYIFQVLPRERSSEAL